jgi:hypothetical protein
MLICIFVKELKEKYLMGTWDVNLKNKDNNEWDY